MNDTKHTPTPWRQREITGKLLSVIVFDGTAQHTATQIAVVRPEDGGGEAVEVASANAAHIVKCVNAHDQLVAALEAIRDLMPNTDRDSADVVARDYQRLARAALAKVTK